LLDTALKAAKACGIPEDHIFIMQLPGQTKNVPFKTVDQLIAEGEALAELPPLAWAKGQGARQVAFLSYSSGTSGLPVGHHAARIFIRPQKLLRIQTESRYDCSL
jgi:acyl-coenzyme A synthetase/AMP-(fatty) acid ligase